MNGKHLVLFAIYELPDQNRDEGIGNLQTLKKFHRIDGVYTFISKYSFRHHLFNELKESKQWKESSVSADSDVIQFDLRQDDILTSPELDAFGYMYTVKGSNAITRKAPVGLTDIVSLEPFEGDTAFYANHDLVRRANEGGKEASPDPFNKEEHYSLYKGGMTINLNRLGVDEWVVDSVKEQNNSIEISIDGKTSKVIINCQPVNEDNLIEDFTRVEWAKEKYGSLLEDPKFLKTEKGFIIYGKIKGRNKYKVLFILNKKELKKRVGDLLEVFLRGVKFQVGGKDYSLTPIFSAVAITKSPLQLFFPNIGIKPLGNNRFEVLGLPYVIENPVMEKVYLNWNEAKIQVDITNINRKEVEPNKKIPEIIDETCNEIFNEKDNSSNNKDSTEGGNNANG
jgi:CRISPR-associated protein Cst2